MENRRSDYRSVRRRRLLLDPALSAERPARRRVPPSTKSVDGEPPLRAYSPAALAERQPRVTDFLPVRMAHLLALVAVPALAVVSVEILYLSTPWWGAALPEESLRPLNPALQGSLAGWLSSLTLALASLFCLVVFAFRQHRVDDYRGQYRLWAWAAAALLVGSIDATTELHRVIDGALDKGLGGVVSTDPALLRGSVLGGAVLAGALRLAMEMRACRGAVAALLAALGGYGAAVLIWLRPAAIPTAFGPASPDVLAIACRTSAVMFGHVGMLLTAALYARHVFLDAQGRLRQRAAKSISESAISSTKEASAPKIAAKPARPKRTDLDSKTPSVKVFPDEVKASDPPKKPVEAAAAKLDAVKPVTAKPSADKPAAPKAAAPKSSSVSPPKAAAAPATERAGKPAVATAPGKPAPQPAGLTDHEDEDGAEESPEMRKLSKAERRKMRKEGRRKERA